MLTVLNVMGQSLGAEPNVPRGIIIPFSHISEIQVAVNASLQHTMGCRRRRRRRRGE